ncbi:unnamed protein product [Symbiodinium sp. CCMP2592]|nr:unnamed protein product [Symbiodinium sp. CCMP2592]
MAAAGALHDEAAKGGPSALLQLVKLVPDLSHAPLREAMAQLVINALLQCQAGVQKCVKLLVEAVGTTDQEPAVCLNAVWALNEIAHSNPAAAEWIAQAGGVQALHRALVAFSSHKDHVDCCTWLMRMVAGPSGLLLLLRAEQPKLPNCVVASVFRVIQKDSACWKDGQSQPKQEAPALVAAIAQHIAALSPDTLYLAMSLFEEMAENPGLSGELLRLGGARLVSAALEVSVRAQDVKTAQSCCVTVIGLTKAGNPSHFNLEVQTCI